MEIIRDTLNIKRQHRGCVVTIGNFDGVHRGHQAILHEMRACADKLSVPTMLACFEPQPKEFFDEFSAPARLTRLREKVGLLSKFGLDFVLCLKFNAATRSQPPEALLRLFGETLAISALFVGDDFRFGANRSGGFADLVQAGSDYGFSVTDLHTLKEGDERVSSTRIRDCLARGDFISAEQLLGYAYYIEGKVVYGRQLGRTLNAATANIQLHRYRAPIDGVYAVEVAGLGPIKHGVANVGVRPTLNENTPRPVLEVHIFDFADDIYGFLVRPFHMSKAALSSGLVEFRKTCRSPPRALITPLIPASIMKPNTGSPERGPARAEKR